MINSVPISVSNHEFLGFRLNLWAQMICAMAMVPQWRRPGAVQSSTARRQERSPEAGTEAMAATVCHRKIHHAII